MNTRYNITYIQWTGTLLHIAKKSRPELAYTEIRLNGYNNCPYIPTYTVLFQITSYIHHHPQIPIMYLHVSINNTIPLKLHFAKGDTEITNCDYSVHTDLEAYADTFFTRDILVQRSTNSSTHTFNDIITSCQCVK